MKDDKKKGKKVARKKTVVKKVKKGEPSHTSKYVGVSWSKREKKWQVMIRIDGKNKGLGLYHDEKEAARIYDEQAALLGKPVNFPLHEGMEQAVKAAPKASGRKRKSRSKSTKNDQEDEREVKSLMVEQDNDEALGDDDDEEAPTC